MKIAQTTNMNLEWSKRFVALLSSLLDLSTNALSPQVSVGK